jgi:uncharacterized damage-inducible protein DinB
MTAQEVRTHLRYSRWASTRLLEAALALPAEQRERDLGVSHKGLIETLNHVHMADRAWLFRVLGKPPQMPAESIEVEWPRIQQAWEDWAASITDADLARVIDYKDMRGNPHRSALFEIVLHVVNHATLHRGQAMAMMRQLGVAPPPTDLIFYFREQHAASV